MGPSGESAPLHVVVAGATGRQGSAVVHALRDRGNQVTAVTRDVNSPAARELEQYGATLAVAALDDSAALTSAVRGADAMFAVTVGDPSRLGVEVRQGVAQVDAAASAGLSHVVLASAASADRTPEVPSFVEKREVEEHATASGVPLTVVAPTFFMDNLFHPVYRPGLEQGELVIDVPEESDIQLVSCRNIADVVATVIARPDAFIGRRLELASDARTGPDLARVIAACTGRAVTYRQGDPTGGVAASRSALFRWLGESGFDVDITSVSRDFPDIVWDDFPSWCADNTTQEPSHDR